MLSTNIDVTEKFNAENGVKIDVAQWQNCTVHVSGTISGTINITGTNDSGSVQGISEGSAVSSVNYTAIQATNLASGAAVTTIGAAGNYKIVVGTKFIQVGGASAATTGKVIIFLTTPT